MPIQGRAIGSPAMTWAMMGLARSMGMAKPMPWAEPAWAVSMPMTLPSPSSERAAGVAGVDGRVGLDEVVRAGWRHQWLTSATIDGAVEAAHDARRDDARELAQRVAHGDGQLADLEGGRVAQLRGRQAGGLDLDEGEVGVGVDARDGALEAAAVREHDADRVGVLDDVVVGEDEAVGSMMTPEPVPCWTKPSGPCRRGSGSGGVAPVTLMVTTAGATCLDDVDDDLVVAGGVIDRRPRPTGCLGARGEDVAGAETAAPRPADTTHSAPMPMACAMPTVRRACSATAVVRARAGRGRLGIGSCIRSMPPGNGSMMWTLGSVV